MRAHLDLGLGTGVVVANPIAADEEMPQKLYDDTLKQALAEAAANGITGRAVTPFLLERMRELTGGESVAVNLALLRFNAALAADLAGAIARLR